MSAPCYCHRITLPAEKNFDAGSTLYDTAGAPWARDNAGVAYLLLQGEVEVTVTVAHTMAGLLTFAFNLEGTHSLSGPSSTCPLDQLLPHIVNPGLVISRLLNSPPLPDTDFSCSASIPSVLLVLTSEWDQLLRQFHLDTLWRAQMRVHAEELRHVPVSNPLPRVYRLYTFLSSEYQRGVPYVAAGAPSAQMWRESYFPGGATTIANATRIPRTKLYDSNLLPALLRHGALLQVRGWHRTAIRQTKLQTWYDIFGSEDTP